MSPRLPRLVATLALLTAAALACALATPSSAPARPGVVVGIEQFGNLENPELQPMLLDAQRDTGAKVIRYIIRYDWVAKCDPRTRGDASLHTNPCYDFAYIDTILRNAEARGMRVLATIYGTPKWKFGREENWTGQTDAQFASFSADLANFSQAAATRYDGRHGQVRMDQWTIWNEPNGSFFEPRNVDGQMVGPQRYARMYDASARRIKAVDPSLKVAVGPTAPFSARLTPMRFAEVALPILQQLGSPIDAWAHNGYVGAQSPLTTTIKPPYVGLGNVSDLTALIDRFPVAAGKPLWITEFGYQTGGVQGVVDVARQAELTADAMYFAWLHPRIETFIWYSLHDDEQNGTAAGFQSGLFYAISKRCGGLLCAKPAAAVFRHTLWMSPRAADGTVTVWGQGRVRPADTRIFARAPGGEWRAFANTDTATNGTVHLRLSLPLGAQVMTCDVRCGPAKLVVAKVADGGGVGPGTANAGTRLVKLRAVRLIKRSALARGISYSVPCGAGCSVSARIVARGRASGIAAARRRQVVIGAANVRTVGTNKVLHARFTLAARRELARRRGATVVLRTVRRDATGSVLISERALVLR